MTAPPEGRDVRERIARRLAPCHCAAPDCRHPVIDATAWRLADLALAEVATWHWGEADHATTACASRPACGRCPACGAAEAHAAAAATLEVLCQGLPPAGHPESVDAELDDDAEEALAEFAAGLWPNDDYLKGDETR